MFYFLPSFIAFVFYCFHLIFNLKFHHLNSNKFLKLVIDLNAKKMIEIKSINVKHNEYEQYDVLILKLLIE